MTDGTKKAPQSPALGSAHPAKDDHHATKPNPNVGAKLSAPTPAAGKKAYTIEILNDRGDKIDTREVHAASADEALKAGQQMIEEMDDGHGAVKAVVSNG